MARASASPSIFTSFFRWLRLKNYQYEVTFALYMLTPTEKVIFNSLLILLISLFVTAAYVYLPNHIVTICNHVWYYWAGDSLSDQPFNAPLHGANYSAANAPLTSATGPQTDFASMATAAARKLEL